MIQELSAGLIIFRQRSGCIEYLLLQKCVGHWTCPKGHLDEGETDIEAALRETNEEAGLKENDFEILNEFKIESSYVSRKGVNKSVCFMIAEIKNPNTPIKISNSHKQYKWFSLNDALKLVKYESVQNGLVKVNDYLSKFRN